MSLLMLRRLFSISALLLLFDSLLSMVGLDGMEEGDDEEEEEDDDGDEEWVLALELLLVSVISDSFAVLTVLDESESFWSVAITLLLLLLGFSSGSSEKEGVAWLLTELGSVVVATVSLESSFDAAVCCADLASSLNFSTFRKSDRFGMRWT
jgi:hypothetical protein